MLGLEWQTVNISFSPTIKRYFSSRDYIPLTGVFYSEQKDIEDIEKELFNNENVKFDLEIDYIGNDINIENLENLNNFKTVGDSFLHIDRIPASMGSSALNLNNRERLSFFSTEESVSVPLKTGGYRYQHWETYKKYLPLIIYYLKHYKYKSVMEEKENVSEQFF